jgi:cytochrome d ubiquinol oxidase subunit II
MTPELYIAALILASLVLYTLLGGADFGGGVWDLLATGPRADDQRRVIAHAIGPVWEANHVWLIAVIVLLFACFPEAYATIATALHLPLSLMLFGIVVRGVSFVFRSYDGGHWRGWSRLFAGASALTPYMLGVCLGASASGRIRVGSAPDLLSAWWAPFPLVTGAFVVAVFAFLAAVYLTLETDDVALQDAFRARALGTAALVTALAWLTFAAMRTGAPHLAAALWTSWWALPFQLTTGALGAGLLAALWGRRYAWARALAMVQATGLVCGFGAAQFPYLVTPDVRFDNAAAPAVVLVTVGVAMTVGLVLLAPAYAWLMRVFKGRTHALS